MKNIIICLEQKNVIIKQMYKITESILSGANDEDITLDDLFIHRRKCMDRIDKCDSLIKEEVLNLSDVEKEKVNNALMGIINKDNNEDDYLQITNLTMSYNDILKVTIEKNNNAKDIIQENYNEYKEKINKIRLKK